METKKKLFLSMPLFWILLVFVFMFMTNQNVSAANFYKNVRVLYAETQPSGLVVYDIQDEDGQDATIQTDNSDHNDALDREFRKRRQFNTDVQVNGNADVVSVIQRPRVTLTAIDE